MGRGKGAASAQAHTLCRPLHEGPRLFVIPAKAGIQPFQGNGEAGLDTALAGMTAGPAEGPHPSVSTPAFASWFAIAAMSPTWPLIWLRIRSSWVRPVLKPTLPSS